MHSCWEGFSVQHSEYFSGQTCPNDMNLPKILTQNRPKYMKSPKILPEISAPYTNRGSQCPPGPPTFYAYGPTQNTFFRTSRSLKTTVNDVKKNKNVQI